MFGHLNILKFFIEHLGCSFNPLDRDSDGNTFVHFAAKSGHLNILKFFVEHLGCSVEVQGSRGSTPIKCALREGHHQVEEYIKSVMLVQKGIEFYKRYKNYSLYCRSL